MKNFFQILLRTICIQWHAIRRDEGVILILLGAPFIYALLYGAIYGSEQTEEIPVVVIDHSHTPKSRQLVRALDATPEIRILGETLTSEEAKDQIYTGEAHGVIHLPKNFANKIYAQEQADISLLPDASYMLYYREILQGTMRVTQTQGAELALEWLVRDSVPVTNPRGMVMPITYREEICYNPTLGYGIFLLPAILILILQQTLLIGEGMIAATRREQGIEERRSPVATLLGRSLTLILLYGLISLLLFGILYPLLGLPAEGSFSTVATLLGIYLSATVLLAQLISHLFHRREEPLIYLISLSIPLLMISGVSLPAEVLPEWIRTLGEWIPSTPAMRGFIRVQTMGASIQEIGRELIHLVCLTLFYGIGALWACSRREKKIVCPSKNTPFYQTSLTSMDKEL